MRGCGRTSPPPSTALVCLAILALPLRAADVGIFMGGANEPYLSWLEGYFDAAGLTWEEIQTVAGIERFRLLAFPGGISMGHAVGLGTEGQRAVREYVAAGGGYIGFCAGAIVASARSTISYETIGLFPGYTPQRGLGEDYLYDVRVDHPIVANAVPGHPAREWYHSYAGPLETAPDPGFEATVLARRANDGCAGFVAGLYGGGGTSSRSPTRRTIPPRIRSSTRGSRTSSAGATPRRTRRRPPRSMGTRPSMSEPPRASPPSDPRIPRATRSSTPGSSATARRR